MTNKNNQNSTCKPIVLIILDGWGHSESPENNPIYEAKTPFFDKLWQKNSHTLLDASGLAVGLPVGQMGNSEVGHITIGAGKVIDTDLVRISKAASDDEFKTNQAFIDLFNHVKSNNSILHVMGLIGPGGIHSHSDHLFAFLKTAKKFGIRKIAIHAFTDGRDTPPQSSQQYLKELENLLDELNIGLIATVSGRFYAMDRDKNWDRLEKAEKAIFHNKGSISPMKPSHTIKSLHKLGLLDEHLESIIFLDDNGRSYPISQNDGVFFFNYRADRARQLAQKLSEKADTQNLLFVTMSQYDPAIKSKVAFSPIAIETTLAKEISKAGLSQVHIAETEKFAHATYYLNGGQNEPHQNEEHILIASRKDIDTHDKAPQMKASEITEKAIEYLDKKTDFIFINYANADMIGHTANKSAIIKAIETLDKELEKLITKIQSIGGTALITADHGNAEISIDENGKPHTAHTLNQVPAILVTPTNHSNPICHSERSEESSPSSLACHSEVSAEESIITPPATNCQLPTTTNLRPGDLSDITPTILQILNIKKPASMTGKSLLS